MLLRLIVTVVRQNCIYELLISIIIIIIASIIILMIVSLMLQIIFHENFSGVISVLGILYK